MTLFRVTRPGYMGLSPKRLAIIDWTKALIECHYVVRHVNDYHSVARDALLAEYGWAQWDFQCS